MASGGPYKIGQRFGPYVLESYLGSGAFKSVYRASNSGGPGPAVVALGFPHQQDPEGIVELEREFTVTSRLIHPHILRVYAVERSEGVAFLVMDYVQGHTLRQELRERGRLAPDAAVRYIALVCDALGYAHGARVFHRDVKPDNIIIGPGARPMLVDFGVARLLARGSEKASTRVGTFEYMAPELFRGAAGTNADLWALGITLFELLTGARPFTGEVGDVMAKIASAKHDETRMRELGVDNRIVRVLRKALSKDPDLRYPTADELMRDLEAAARRTQVVHDDEGRLEVLLKASVPLVYAVSFEEEHVLQTIRAVAARMAADTGTERPVFVWSSSRGLRGADGTLIEARSAGDPVAALSRVIEREDSGIYVFLDIHRHFGPVVSRLLRDAARAVRTSHRSIVILSPSYGIPPEVEQDAAVLVFQLPDRTRLEAAVETAAASLEADGVVVDMSRDTRDGLARAAKGLTEAEAERSIRLTAMEAGRLDETAVRRVGEHKRQVIRRSGILEYFDAPETFEDVAGLENLLDWFAQRHAVFAGRAAFTGLPMPKGVLLAGVPGCGKSLCARSLAGAWGVPLVRLDVGRVFGPYVGDSEANLRRAIHTAEAVSPCILWIDEIEKGFASSRGQGGSGVGARVFGSFLTWMQEKRSPVFVAATANDPTALPPEFLRQGRFDETFFVGLPGPPERRSAWSVHLQKRSRSPAEFDLDRLVQASELFSGAEIEQAVISGLFRAFTAGRKLADEDLAAAADDVFPLAKAQQRHIGAIIAWGSQYARPASRR
jgi:hypothetical protein